MIKQMSKRSWNISLSMCWKTVGALVRPNGINLYSKCPYQVRKYVFHSSSGRIHTRLCAPRKSILVKHLAPLILSKRLEIRGNAYIFLMVILFKPWYSTTKRSEPSFFFTKKMGAPVGDFECRINPFAKISSM